MESVIVLFRLAVSTRDLVAEVFRDAHDREHLYLTRSLANHVVFLRREHSLRVRVAIAQDDPVPVSARLLPWYQLCFCWGGISRRTTRNKRDHV